MTVLKPIAALFVLALPSFVLADTSQRVGGYFCDSVNEQIAFLERQSSGDNDIIAANTVNKAASRQACADYMSVDVVPKGERVVVRNGLAFKLFRVEMLPSKVERWTGSITGSLDVLAQERDT